MVQDTGSSSVLGVVWLNYGSLDNGIDSLYVTDCFAQFVI